MSYSGGGLSAVAMFTPTVGGTPWNSSKASGTRSCNSTAVSYTESMRSNRGALVVPTIFFVATQRRLAFGNTIRHCLHQHSVLACGQHCNYDGGQPLVFEPSYQGMRSWHTLGPSGPNVIQKLLVEHNLLQGFRLSTSTVKPSNLICIW